jgi:diamine N-acetyltransferase
MFTIVNATEEHIPVIQEIANKTWWPTYSPILSEQQLQYMLDKIYDRDTLRQAINDKLQNFILLQDESGFQGFASFSPRQENPSVYKLHKIYVLPQNHGKGYGRVLIDEVISRSKTEGARQLDLNVNRFNKAKTFYEKLGFKVVREEDVPVGPYWMNDYVMSKGL